MSKITIRNLQLQNDLIDVQKVYEHEVVGGCGSCLYTPPVYTPPVYTPPVYTPPVYIPACSYIF